MNSEINWHGPNLNLNTVVARSNNEPWTKWAPPKLKLKHCCSTLARSNTEQWTIWTPPKLKLVHGYGTFNHWTFRPVNIWTFKPMQHSVHTVLKFGIQNDQRSGLGTNIEPSAAPQYQYKLNCVGTWIVTRDFLYPCPVRPTPLLFKILCSYIGPLCVLLKSILIIIYVYSYTDIYCSLSWPEPSIIISVSIY